MNSKLTALLALELDSIPCPNARARRAVELLQAMTESFADDADECSFRCFLLNCAADMEGDANLGEEMEAERVAEYHAE